MNIFAVLFCVGCSQVLVDGIVDLVPAPYYISHERLEMNGERWECPKCGHDNNDWTSICGRCGRTKPSGMNNVQKFPNHTSA